MKIKVRNPFSRKKQDPKNNENVIVHDNAQVSLMQAEGVEEPKSESREEVKEKGKFFPALRRRKVEKVETKGEKENEEIPVRSRSPFERFAFGHLSRHLPGLNEFKEGYEQSGIPVIFEAYVSTGFLISFITAVPVLVLSLLLQIRFLPRLPLQISIVGSIVLSFVASAVTLAIWLFYPMIRRRSFKTKLESQLAYSFGILGVLAAAGMNLERLFERIATSESNPVLADLAKRLLRNIRVFGLDTESALAEVAQHSPSEQFSKMLDSISVAHKTTGSIHDLVMFESARLLQEKRDKLRKTIGSLAVMAELYITVVVVGPIIFIVMMAIFGLLPAGGLPNPISIINLIVFIGVPVLSVMFVLLLDSVVSKA